MTDASIAETTDTSGAVEPPARNLGLVKVVGVLGILGGIALIVAGLVVWIMVSTQLQAENITIPDDAMAFQGQTVAGPFTAYVQADIIQHHALEASGGKTYAELEQDDPVRAGHDDGVIPACVAVHVGRRRSASPRSPWPSECCRSSSAGRCTGSRVLRSSSSCRGPRELRLGDPLLRTGVRTVHPHDALTEIATLLERERSSRYKSKAFRTAADAIEGLSDEQLRDAADSPPPQGDRRLDLRRDPGGARGPRSRLPGGPARAGRSAALVGAARHAARRPAQPQRVVGRPHLDRPDGRGGAGARSRVPRADRPLAAPAGRERSLARTAARHSWRSWRE